ncbi:ALP1-like protein isoform X1 [Tanacetum coccineum]|uniref:ALP1-like protein isoform X1 n=1 Tax=Tanacetum coccineum TaxID=301880 RepID=A0ABQ5EK45_9ASTR
MLAEKELRDEAERSSRLRIERGREDGQHACWAVTSIIEPVFPPCKFRRMFRMNKVLFMKIVDVLSDHYDYFKPRHDALGIKGLSPIQKCTTAIRQLAYGTPADCNDEYVRIGESISIECLKKFCQGVIEIFGPLYLRRPNAEDVERILHLHSEHYGFPGMLGSIDCMHWPWKNCPVSWQGQFTRGDHGEPTIMLEAVASQDLWIWHAFFGVANSNNDINVLNQSTLFNDYLQGHSLEVRFTINGTKYTKGYYLADGIYPEWATIVKSFPCPQDPKRKKFKEMQEAARKDVKRAFGVLQSRWAIIREEELLMSALVTISTDNVTGNAQQGKDYWRRITNYYNDYRKSFPSRTQTKVKSHWYQLLPSINDFNQIFIDVKRQYHSGWSDDQVKNAARKLYYSAHNKAFKYEHAWVVVKDEPKWNARSTNEDQTKRRKTTALGSYTSSSDGQTSINIDDEETQVRPIGKKQASRKQKGKGTTSSAEVNDGLRDLINNTNTMRMARIDEVNEHIKEIKESHKSSKRIEELRILSQSTQGMTDEQLGYHNILYTEIKAKYGI